MTFNNKAEFISWFETTIKAQTRGWTSPSSCEKAANRICRAHISKDIEIPSPYENWSGIKSYAALIWDKNYSLMTKASDYTSSAKNYTSSKGYQSSTYSHNNTTSYNCNSVTNYTSGGPSQSGTGIVKRHNFDNYLRKIQTFSNNVPYIPSIEKFETDGGLFGWGDHYINGREMNLYAEKVQDLFKTHNKIIIETIQEFRDVYSTFNYLDQEYLTGIVQAVNAATSASNGAKEASNQAKTASDQAKAAADKALKNEADLQKDVENLRKLVEKIKSIKEDLSGRINNVESSIERLQNKLQQVYASLSKAKHLEDIDDLWELTEMQKESITQLKNKIERLESKSRSNSDATVQQVLPEEKHIKWDIILAYVIGGAGLIVSICSLAF